MVRKFRATVTETKEYIISIDDKVYDKKFMDTFSEVFHPIDTLEDIALDLAFHQASYGNDGFIEGYGVVSRNKKFADSTYKKAEGLDIKIISEDKPEIDIEEF